MTDFHALMSTWKLFFADLATVGSGLVAKNVVHHLFTTITEARDKMETWGTIACVALHGARMTTWLWFQTWTSARGSRNSTFDGRIDLGNATGTVKRLIRNNSAWLAESDMAEISALVKAT